MRSNAPTNTAGDLMVGPMELDSFSEDIERRNIKTDAGVGIGIGTGLGIDTDEKGLWARRSSRQHKPIERQYHVDWRRFTAVSLMVAAHISVTMERVVDMATEHPYHQSIKAFQLNLLQYGLGVFFDAAGRAQVKKCDTAMIFFKKRCGRLLMPLCVGMIFILPMNEFIGRRHRPSQPAGAIDLNFAQYYGAFWRNVSSLDYFWFLPTLFCISIYNFLIGNWMYRIKHRSDTKLSMMDVASGATLGVLHVFVFPLIGGYIFNWTPTFSVGFGLAYFWIILLALSFDSNKAEVEFELFTFLMLLSTNLTLASSVGAGVDGLQAKIKLPRPMAEFVLATVFYNLFFLHGMFHENFLSHLRVPRQCTTRGAPMIFLFVSVVGFAYAGQPTILSDMAYIWAYPAYKKPYLALLFCTSTVCSLYIFDYLSQAVLPGNFDPQFHMHAMSIAYVTYVIHGVPLELVSANILYPRRKTMHIFGAIALLLLGILSFCLIAYYIMLSVSKAIAKLRFPRNR